MKIVVIVFLMRKLAAKMYSLAIENTFIICFIIASKKIKRILLREV